MCRGFDVPTSNRRQLWQQQSEELLESATDRQLDDLEASIGGLKQLGHEINHEIGRSNSILDELVRILRFNVSMGGLNFFLGELSVWRHQLKRNVFVV